jgi:acyl-Coa thioesterase superfamily protein
VASGAYPRTTWKYWVTRKMNPSRAKNTIAIEPLAAVNRGLRNRLTSIIGWAVARSAATSTPRVATPAASVPRVAAEAQPQPGAWMMPYTISPIPAEDSTRARQSTRGDWILLDAETWLGPGGRAIAAGRLADRAGYFARCTQSLLVEPRADRRT